MECMIGIIKGGGWPRCYNTDNVTTSSGAMTYKKVYKEIYQINIKEKLKMELLLIKILTF